MPNTNKRNSFHGFVFINLNKRTHNSLRKKSIYQPIMTVTVTYLATGETLSCKASTVSELKQEIQDLKGIPPRHQVSARELLE